MADELTLTARWVFPVAEPPIENGVVTVAGDRIAAVTSHGTRTADLDLGNVAICPGFVNAHTHLDLTGARGKTLPSPDFVGWLRQVIAFRRGRAPDEVAADVRAGISECLRYGTTVIGDIAADGATWEALERAPVRATVFRELLGLTAGRADTAWDGFTRWREVHRPTPTCRPGASPHAPYSVSRNLFQRAGQAGLPIAVHVAESIPEIELLERRTGPFVDLLKELAVWEPDQLVHSHAELLDLMPRSAPLLFVHGSMLIGNYPMPSNGTFVFCPRTSAGFTTVEFHPFRLFMSRGVRVALGTDSLASNPDLSVLSEARFIRSIHLDFPGDALLRLATQSGAEALGWSDETGSLLSGKSADFAVVALPDRDAGDPHKLLFESELPVVATWFRGRKVWSL
jgi:cytosine/adenosine deaminase-related metal-dependent hydrolase